MSDELKNFCNNMGVLIETWMLTFRKFKELGLSDEEAIKHTQAFMVSLFKNGLK